MEARQPLEWACARAPGAAAARAPGVSLAARRLLIPDLSLIVALKTLFWCLFIFDGFRALFRDSDTGWHIRTGESILNGAGLPHSDPYSLLRAGQPWFAWEWGADAIMGALHQWGGLAAVAAFYALLIALCSWLWFRIHWAAGGHFLIACVLALPMLSTVNMHWLARPHVFGWVLLLIALWFAETASPRMNASRFAAIVLFGSLWANLHASFFLGPLLAGLYVIGHWLGPRIWEAGEPGGAARARMFAAAAAALALGSLLNPWGWQLHAHILRYLTDAELIGRIGEFQSFNFHAEGSSMIVAALAFGAAGAVLALCEGRLHWFLVSVLLLIAGVRSARGLPIIALAVLPLANAAVTRALAREWPLRHAARRRLDSFLQYGRNLRSLDARFSGVVWVPAVVAVTFAVAQAPSVRAYAGFPPEEFPVRAAEHVAKLPADARILAPDKFGGYLIYRFNGERKVWFDGRSDFYGSAYMKDYLRLIEVRPGWREQLERAAFTHALVPNRYSLVPALEALGWRTMHRDEVATLLAKP